MVCEHLKPLDEYLRGLSLKENFRGQAWTANSREWVYYDAVLDLKVLRAKFKLPAIVEERIHAGTHDGQEAGFICREHSDAIMGLHPLYGNSKQLIT